LNENQLETVGRVWRETIEGGTWNKDSATLREAVEALNHKELTLGDYNRLLGEILSSQFLRKKMPQVFRKHERQLKEAVTCIQKTLALRKEVARGMRDFYLAKHQIPYGENGTFICEFGASDVKETLNEVIDQYSFDALAKTYDKSTLSPALNEIESTLASPLFTVEYVGTLIAEFAAEGGRQFINENTLRPVVRELIGQLIQNGHHLGDLSSLGKSMESQGPRTPDERFKSVISSLTASLRSFVVLTSLEDIRFPGNESYKVGNVTLHGQDYDLTQLTRRFIPAMGEIGKRIVDQWSKRVIAEISTVAFGNEQAKESADQEAAKAIDILSLEDPNVLIREPREEKFSRFIVLDDKMTPVDLSFANRRELMGKELDPSTRGNTDKILASLASLLTKPRNQLTEFERRILTGIHFYRRGNSAFDFRDKVVNYIVSLESVLVMEREHPSGALPKRVLDVLGVSEDYRSAVRRLMEDAYHHRGEILHLGLSDKQESERYSREMRVLDRRILGIMLTYVGKPGCDTLRQFADLLEKETFAERERILKTAILEINKQFVGTGVLKHPNGSDIGNIEFILSYKDDGRYVYILGEFTRFKLKGSVSSSDTGYYIMGEIDGVAGSYRLDLSALFNPIGLMELGSEERNTLPFQLKSISRL
jgi:hypothetical protein